MIVNSDKLRDLESMVDEQRVFLLPTTGGYSYPEGYTVAQPGTYWKIEDGRVTGGTSAISVEKLPYEEFLAGIASLRDP